MKKIMATDIKPTQLTRTEYKYQDLVVRLKVSGEKFTWSKVQQGEYFGTKRSMRGKAQEK
jgi:hypothetical protein|tara:strand:- start:238 stop:417 length:180 start_codon:yes stop_codon:yes gene_type:complete